MKSHQAQPHDSAVILMVDDNEHGLIARKTVLKQNGFESLTATSAEDGLGILDRHHVDLVVTDYRMGGMNGIDFIGHLRTRQPDMPVILLSGFVEPLGLDERSTGADAVLMKCGNEAAFLVRAVNRLLNRRKPAKKETRGPKAAAHGVG